MAHLGGSRQTAAKKKMGGEDTRVYTAHADTHAKTSDTHIIFSSRLSGMASITVNLTKQRNAAESCWGLTANWTALQAEKRIFKIGRPRFPSSTHNGCRAMAVHHMGHTWPWGRQCCGPLNAGRSDRAAAAHRESDGNAAHGGGEEGGPSAGEGGTSWTDRGPRGSTGQEQGRAQAGRPGPRSH